MNFSIGAFITIPLVFAAIDDQGGTGSTGQTTSDDAGAPRFDAENALILPKDYREWVFVGSSLGLGYDGDQQPGKEAGRRLGQFKHIYINRRGYRAYRDTGRFPVGTVLILEGVSRGEKTNPKLRGYFSHQFRGLEAAVKTGDRFDDPWTYFQFTRSGKRLAKAKRLETKSCIRCHRKHAKTDHVFTQFYPVLQALRPAP